MSGNGALSKEDGVKKENFSENKENERSTGEQPIRAAANNARLKMLQLLDA